MLLMLFIIREKIALRLVKYYKLKRKEIEYDLVFLFH